LSLSDGATLAAIVRDLDSGTITVDELLAILRGKGAAVVARLAGVIDG
jgi:hypothetical protein